MAKIYCGVWIMDKFMWRKRKAFLKEECEDMIEKFEQTPFKDKNAEDIECDFKYFDNYRQYSCFSSSITSDKFLQLNRILNLISPIVYLFKDALNISE